MPLTVRCCGAERDQGLAELRPHPLLTRSGAVSSAQDHDPYQGHAALYMLPKHLDAMIGLPGSPAGLKARPALSEGTAPCARLELAMA